MFSFEILDLLKNNNYKITIEQYKQITDTSPQITWSKCFANENRYCIYLDDISKELSFIIKEE